MLILQRYHHDNGIMKIVYDWKSILIATCIYCHFILYHSFKDDDSKIHLILSSNLGEDTNNDIKTHQVHYLPPIKVEFTHPDNYPSVVPPTYNLTCPWLTQEQVILYCFLANDIERHTLKVNVWMFFMRWYSPDPGCWEIWWKLTFQSNIVPPFSGTISEKTAWWHRAK